MSQRIWQLAVNLWKTTDTALFLEGLHLAQSIKGSKLYLQWRGIHLISAVPDSPHRPSKCKRSSPVKAQPSKDTPLDIMVGDESATASALSTVGFANA